MKDCYTILLPVIAGIINLSFDNATIPANFTEAVLDPILKKDSLDHEVHKNFRSFSNLRFVSKATEKVVALRLNQHLVNNNLHEMFQSAYRIEHSTETALTRIHNDILLAIDDSSCIILVLLDFSAALDAVDHNILLRLELRFGITGKALSWLTFYLTDRTQFVQVANEHSTSRKLLCGVPQGSVLGPVLYAMYTAPLADITRQHGLNFHFYADDTLLSQFVIIIALCNKKGVAICNNSPSHFVIN